jgi:hypothetical protein
LESLSNKPHQYDDSCIYKAFTERTIGNSEKEAQYIKYFDKTFEENTYHEFYKWLLDKADYFKISIVDLLSFLYLKKKRNFEEHSDINDFIVDCQIAGQCDFKQLSKKYHIDGVTDQQEYDALEKNFLCYYHAKIDYIRRKEEIGAVSK